MSNYDSDDALNRSPGLQPVRSNLTPTPPRSPVPLPISSSSTETASRTPRPPRSKGTKAQAPRKKFKISQGDVILLRYLAPDCPELATGVGSRDHDSHSPSVRTDSEEPMEVGLKVSAAAPPTDRPPPTDGFNYGRPRLPTRNPSVTRLNTSLDVARDPVNADQDAEITGRTRSETKKLERRRSSQQTFQLHHLPPPPPLNLSSDHGRRHADEAEAASVLANFSNSSVAAKRQRQTEESIATSPTLAPHLLDESRSVTGEKLPALTCGSPVEGRSKMSPPKENLPPLRVAVPDATIRPRQGSMSSMGTGPVPSPPRRVGHHSPFGFRPPSLPSSKTGSMEASPPDAIGANSPESAPSISGSSGAYHPRRKPMGAPPPSFTGNHRSTSSSGRSVPSVPSIPSLPSLPSIQTTSSTDAVFTPSSHATPSDRQASVDTPQSNSGLPQGTTYLHYPTVPIAGYKCPHEGCDAAPFSTQYLLNSHANVHSQERPHYCHVKGCSRGEGGRGFKRKNEMIRHGLVHQSPGYVCPWCPDKEHKYPRPDNLQRHVRMHHKDKDTDDPQLREVLAQRMTGASGRGRKRRN